MEHRHPHLDVADAHAVVDQPARFPLLVPAIDIGSAHFELERGGDAVGCFVPVGFVRLSVLVKIDEAGRDDESRGVDRSPPLQRAVGDGGNLSAADSDAPDRVQSRFRIDDTTVQHDELEVLRPDGNDGGDSERRQENSRWSRYADHAFRALHTARRY